MSWLRRASTVFCVCLLLFTPAFAAQPAGASKEPNPASAPTPPLFHGNWCGLGDIDREKPKDALDAACRAHDLCYEKAGRNACSCDRAFLKATARLVASRRIDETLRSKAATANSLFSATPCVESENSRRAARKR